ncbi:hypothetical protein M7I_6419 [Glarea lozoyensis 74030]|uniref:Uncharacterized protein n=1 Tax=Glarea lozoyensis (strain ATCC 74030 / MF5533) TaxID=1104152 RepID=H0EUG2_GLAL7|nr:hypothetical protein M7I_6419 [Glarea lozoyensis 74030]
MSVYINGSKNDIFFEIKTTRGEVPVVAQVKQSVTEWIAQLHAHKKCPKFVHDVLNIIENHMLVVLSEEKKRHTSTALKKAFHEINKLCRANESHDYCVQGIPTPVTPQPNVPVAVLLNENAQNMLDNNRSHLSVHDGRTRNSMTVESLRRMEIAGNVPPEASPVASRAHSAYTWCHKFEKAGGVASR